MTTTKLTAKMIKALVYEGQVYIRRGRKVETRDVRWDSEVPGLGLRLYPSGGKTFVFSYRVKRRKRLMTLGRFGAKLTLKQARVRARKRSLEAEDGIDPLEEKRKGARGKTLGDLIDAYLSDYARPHKKTWKADEQRLARNIPASWRSRDAAAIMPWEVAKLHRDIGARAPYEANRLIEIIKRMFTIAPTLIAVDAALENPAKGITKFREHKRARWARPEELLGLAQAIDEEPNVFVRSAIWLYMLTGLRKTELLEARRNDIDWTRGTLRLADPKAGEEQFATLSDNALAIAQATPALSGNPYLLPGAKPGRHLVNIGKPWGRIRARATVILWAASDDNALHGLVDRLARNLGRPPRLEEVRAAAADRGLDLPTGIADLRLHDLRRTVGAWMSESGVDLNRIKDALRHANVATTLIYARLSEDAAREPFEEHGRRILEAAGKSRPVEVVGGGPEK